MKFFGVLIVLILTSAFAFANPEFLEVGYYSIYQKDIGKFEIVAAGNNTFNVTWDQNKCDASGTSCTKVNYPSIRVALVRSEIGFVLANPSTPKIGEIPTFNEGLVVAIEPLSRSSAKIKLLGKIKAELRATVEARPNPIVN